jgi:hypothetical protein
VPLPNFGAPVPPKMGGPPGPPPSQGPPPPGGPSGPGAPAGPPPPPDMMGAPPAGPPGMDGVGSAVSAQIGAIRPIVQGLLALGEQNPAVQPLIQQVLPIMKQIVQMMLQSGPTQTDSASALPTGG